ALLERRGIELAGALVEQRRDHEGGALAALLVGRRAAAEADHGGDQRIAMVLDQPGGDAARAHHLLDVDGVGRGRQRHQDDARQRHPQRHPGESRDPPASITVAAGWIPAFAGMTSGRKRAGQGVHEYVSLSQLVGLGSSTPVTEFSGCITARAAAITSAAVTAPIFSGQASSSPSVPPVVSAAPIVRAGPVRLSRALTAAACSSDLAVASSCSVTPSRSSLAISAPIACSTGSTWPPEGGLA